MIYCTMNKSDLTVVIVSRVGCWKCEDIKVTCSGDGVQVTSLNWHEGGAAFLAKYKHIPMMLPTTLVFRGKELLWCADGLSGFLEKWEEMK